MTRVNTLKTLDVIIENRHCAYVRCKDCPLKEGRFECIVYNGELENSAYAQAVKMKRYLTRKETIDEIEELLNE